MRNFGNSCCCAKSPSIKAPMLHNSMGAIISANDMLIPNPQSFTLITYRVQYRVSVSQWGALGCATFLTVSLVERIFMGLSGSLKCAPWCLGNLKIAF